MQAAAPVWIRVTLSRTRRATQPEPRTPTRNPHPEPTPAPQPKPAPHLLAQVVEARVGRGERSAPVEQDGALRRGAVREQHLVHEGRRGGAWISEGELVPNI